MGCYIINFYIKLISSLQGLSLKQIKQFFLEGEDPTLGFLKNISFIKGKVTRRLI